MSDLILRWLNKDVGLSQKVGAFEKDFSSGYLYAELLHRHGLLGGADLEDYSVDTCTASKRQNFAKLGAALSSSGSAGGLGIRLKDQQVSEIMDEDRGASLRLLFQLKKGLEKAKLQALGVTAAASRTRDVASKIQRSLHGDDAERFFEQQLKPVKRTDPRVAHELHAKRFVDEHTFLMKRAEDTQAADYDALRRRQVDFRNARMDTMRMSKALKKERLMDGDEHGHETKLQMIAALERDLNFEKKSIKKEIRKADQVRERHRVDCGYGEDDPEDDPQGINWFEKNLQRIGIDTSGESGPGPGYREIVASNMKEMHDEMQKRLPHAAELQIESQKKMGKIKDVKKAYDRARKERANRQHRTMLEQRDNQAKLAATKMAQDLLVELQVETQGYQQEARCCDLHERYREAMRHEREERHHSYAERAARESEEAYQRLKEKCRAERDSMLKEKREEAERARLRNAQGIGAPPSSADTDSDDDEVAGLNMQGTLKANSTKDLTQSIAGDCNESESLAPAKELMACVDNRRVADYLFARGMWSPFVPSVREAEAMVEGASPALGAPVEDISSLPWRPKLGCLVRWLMAPKPQTLSESQLPTNLMPIVAIAGNPAGLDVRGTSMAVARSIQKEREFAIVEPQKVVVEAISLARKLANEPEWPTLARMHKLGRALLQAQAAGEQGEAASVPPAIYAELVFRKIELLSAPPPKSADEEEDQKTKAKAKAKAKAKGKAPVAEEPEVLEVPKGVVVVGFPIDVLQQAAWEEAARAYCSPLMCILDGEEDLQAQLSSIIAPWLPAHDTLQYKAPFAAPVSSESPLRHVRLSWVNQRQLSDAVVTEAASQEGWEAVKPPSTAADETEGAAEAFSMLCMGYEKEFSTVANPVDRAWLFDEMHLLSQAFLLPLGNTKEIVLDSSPCDDGEEPASLEEFACTAVLEQVAAWLEKDPARDTKRMEDEVEAEVPRAEDAAAATVAAETQHDEVGKEGVDGGVGESGRRLSSDIDEIVVDAQPAPKPEPWRDQLLEVERDQMRVRWLATLSSYLVGLRDTFGEVESHAAQYGTELVKMQRDFLDFLQRDDNKAHILHEFFKAWSKQKAVAGRPIQKSQEELDELSDQLWQVTDRRRGDSIDELTRLMETSGFWEGQAGGIIILTRKLQRAEQRRYQSAVALLCSAYSAQQDVLENGAEENDIDQAGVSSLEDCIGLLQQSTLELAGVPPPTDANDQIHPELRGALKAIRLDFVTRIKTLETWAAQLLASMREQLDETFRRQDDWIRDRVSVENEAIRATIAQVAAGPPADQSLHSPVRRGFPDIPFDMSATLNTTIGTRGSTKHPVTPSASNNPLKRWRREVAKLLEPSTLDVDIYSPPPLEVRLQATETSDVPELTWTEPMLRGLLECMLKRRRLAALAPSAVLEAILEQRSSAYRFESASVPSAWTKRSELALELFCTRLFTPRWGANSVDITEMLLMLTLDTRGTPWPSLESLQAARAIIESEMEGTEFKYPDCPVGKKLFKRLPLWDTTAKADIPVDWLFDLLSCFDDSTYGDGNRRPSTVSARRLFAYLGLGLTPFEGIQNILQLLLPRGKSMGSAPDADTLNNEVLVPEVWKVVFSIGSRPESAVAPPIDLEPFCRELVPPPPPPEPPAPVKLKKGEAPPPPPEPIPPPPPDEVRVSGDATYLSKHPAILRALCTHGALLARKRCLQALFPVAGPVGEIAPPPLQNAAGAAALEPLPSLIQPTEEEAAPPDEA